MTDPAEHSTTSAPTSGVQPAVRVSSSVPRSRPRVPPPGWPEPKGALSPRFSRGHVVRVLLPGEVEWEVAFVLFVPDNVLATPYALLLSTERSVHAFEVSITPCLPDDTRETR
jgi:hypothetical protein